MLRGGGAWIERRRREPWPPQHHTHSRRTSWRASPPRGPMARRAEATSSPSSHWRRRGAPSRRVATARPRRDVDARPTGAPERRPNGARAALGLPPTARPSAGRTAPERHQREAPPARAVRAPLGRLSVEKALALGVAHTQTPSSWCADRCCALLGRSSGAACLPLGRCPAAARATRQQRPCGAGAPPSALRASAGSVWLAPVARAGPWQAAHSLRRHHDLRRPTARSDHSAILQRARYAALGDASASAQSRRRLEAQEVKKTSSLPVSGSSAVCPHRSTVDHSPSLPRPTVRAEMADRLPYPGRLRQESQVDRSEYSHRPEMRTCCTCAGLCILWHLALHALACTRHLRSLAWTETCCPLRQRVRARYQSLRLISHPFVVSIGDAGAPTHVNRTTH